MAYKSILTVLTDDKDAAPVLDAVIPFLRAEGAHLDVLCLGIDHTQTGYYGAGATTILLEETLALAQQNALRIEMAARERLRKSEISWGVEAIVTQTAGMTALVSRRARFADLVILPKPYGAGKSADDPEILETAMFKGHAPVLVLDGAKAPPNTPKRVVIAWNESQEALAAIRSALPILKAATAVDILVIAPERRSASAADPAVDLATLLSRHGVVAEISVVAQTLSRVSEQITRFVADKNADFLVMGAYGHSRLREAILGGATRNLLEHSSVPVLLAH